MLLINHLYDSRKDLKMMAFLKFCEALAKYIGASPSGKAAVFGTAMRGFESLRPKSQLKDCFEASSG